MLLIDGVKYELWTPQKEDEFERAVDEHIQEIFGEASIYLDRKQKLKSLSGIGSIPDGYAIILGNSPQWHIVEAELSSHPLHEHIVSQVSKFINGIRNPTTQREMASAIYTEVTRDAFLKLRVERAIQSNEIYKFLSDLFSKPPVLTIIIEKDTEGLREALNTLAHPEIKVVEFRTFRRVGAEAVHVHLFEPLCVALPPPPPPPPRLVGTFDVTLQPSYIQSNCVYIPAAKKDLFPTSDTTLELHTDIGVIPAEFSVNSWGTWVSKGLSKWFTAHRELKQGDRVRVTVLEPLKKYRLEIVK